MKGRFLTKAIKGTKLTNRLNSPLPGYFACKPLWISRQAAKHAKTAKRPALDHG
jgi:hypothetical protein